MHEKVHVAWSVQTREAARACRRRKRILAAVAVFVLLMAPSPVMMAMRAHYGNVIMFHKTRRGPDGDGDADDRQPPSTPTVTVTARR
jgi:hypothetical protein